MRKQWTQGKINSVVKGALRSSSRFYPPKLDALDEASAGVHLNRFTGRMAKHRKCAICGEIFPDKMIQVDHTIPVIDPLTGFTSWDDVVARLFCSKENFKVLCKPCHKIKTGLEKDQAKERKANAK
jgi:5-methylcytosine-specific restriction endonuclease McrA